MTGPLAGVRIIDLTSVLLGPYATQWLGDFGADVIKVEAPFGDPTRKVGPSRNSGMASGALSLNRNKRSIVLDLKKPAGKEALLRLVKRADVLVFNMRPKAMKSLGLSYEETVAAAPSIIYCGASGFGQSGPYADLPAYDDVIQASSGLAAMQGYMANCPQYHAQVTADKTVGIVVALAISAALVERERTGKGQEIEVPMFETMVANVLVEHQYGMTFDPPLGDAGYPRATSRFRRPYATKDGFLAVTAYSDAQWLRLFGALDREQMIRDPRFATMESRTANIDELYSILAEALLERTNEEWIEILRSIDIPVMAVLHPRDLPDDPHLQAVGLFKQVDHPSEGRLVTVASPVRWSNHPNPTSRPVPRKGEHTAEVLQEVGFSENDIAEMRAAGAIA